MSDPVQRPEFVLDSPGAFPELIPYLMGFTPQESLVIVVLRDQEMQVIARADIAELDPPGAVGDLMDRIWRRFPSADAFFLAYTENPVAGWELLHRCSSWLPLRAAHETMVVTGDTWQLSDGSQGTITDSARISAEAVQQGFHRVERRADLEAHFASAEPSKELNHQLSRALDALPAAGERAAIIARTGQLLRQNLPDHEPSLQDALTKSPANLSAADALQLALLVMNPQATDLALLSITSKNARSHLQLWRSVVNHAPDNATEIALVVAGMAAWVSGEGVVASIALERSQQAASTTSHIAKPEPPALLHDLIEQVVTPATWPHIRTALLAHANPRVRNEIAAPRQPRRQLERPGPAHPQQNPEPVHPRPADAGPTF